MQANRVLQLTWHAMMASTATATHVVRKAIATTSMSKNEVIIPTRKASARVKAPRKIMLAGYLRSVYNHACIVGWCQFKLLLLVPRLEGV